MKDRKSGNFATKLLFLLNNTAHETIIAWRDNNKAIEVVDESRMESEILPLYFRQTKFKSFVRQLNLYGFRKVKAQQALKFTHPCLQKGQDLSNISIVKLVKNKAEVNEIRPQSKAPQRLIAPLEVTNNEEGQDRMFCDSLGQNRSTSQIKNSPIQEKAPNYPFCFTPIVQYTINPYLCWNFSLYSPFRKIPHEGCCRK